MSVEERALAQSLAKHEKIIERGTLVFIEVGNALAAIRDEQLYKLSHKTFEDYVLKRWGFSRLRAYQLIEASEVTRNLYTIVDKTALPPNEAQLREIAKAPKEKQAEVVKKAAEKAAEENRKPTAKDYKKVVGELLLEGEGPVVESPEPSATPPEPEPPPAPSHHPKEMAGPLMGHVKALIQMNNDLKKRAVDRGGEWIDLQAISTHISSLKYSLKSSIYYADCPACGGKRCAKCKQTGFLPALKSSVVEEAK